MMTTPGTTALPNSPLTDFCEPGLIRSVLLRAFQGPGPHTLLEGQAELILFEGQYLLHWLDTQGQDQFKFLSATSVREAFSEQTIASGWLPPGVQQWGMNAGGAWMVEWIPPGRQTITLLGPSMPQEPVSVPLPGLIFVGIGSTYTVWAVKEDTFTPTSSVYHAPFPNIRTDGSICFGTNEPPTVASATWAVAWQIFITSPFNGDLITGKSRRHGGDIRQALCAVRKKPCYPTSDLIPFKSYAVGDRPLTVSEALERLLLPKNESDPLLA